MACKLLVLNVKRCDLSLDDGWHGVWFAI